MEPIIIAATITGFLGLAGGIFASSIKGDGKNSKSSLNGSTVKYEDLVKHCGAQQAMRDKSLETMFEPIKQRLDRGDEQFETIKKEIHRTHIELLKAIQEM